jgi:DNA modification methylase
MGTANIAESLRPLATPIGDLSPLPGNPRKGDVEAVKRSYERFGQRKPIVANRDGTVIAGNHQLKAAQALGWDEIAVVFVDDDDQTAKAFALADNRTADLGTYDDQALADLLAEVAIDPELLLATGYDLDALADLDASLDLPTVDEPDEVPTSAPAKTIKGDVWLLGPHRLMCGDSTVPTDVERLMAGAKANICFTSPPYALGKNISLSGNKTLSDKKSAYDDHKDDAEQWPSLMRNWFNASHEAVRDAWLVNVQLLAGNKRDLIAWLNENSGRLIDVAVWDKGHAQPAMAEGVMNSRFELLAAFGEQNASRAFPLSSWRGTIPNVYEAPLQTNNEFANVHGATMPTHLPIWVMSKLFDQCESVYEPFAGTGTTLIAAHMTKKVAYGMEISPAYCDIICKRWQTKTGIKPIAESTGREHDFLAE